jgi:hypothetical protein
MDSIRGVLLLLSSGTRFCGVFRLRRRPAVGMRPSGLGRSSRRISLSMELGADGRFQFEF